MAFLRIIPPPEPGTLESPVQEQLRVSHKRNLSTARLADRLSGPMRRRSAWAAWPVFRCLLDHECHITAARSSPNWLRNNTQHLPSTGGDEAPLHNLRWRVQPVNGTNKRH